MKNLILLFCVSCIFSTTLTGQKQSPEKIRASFWNADDPYKSVVDIPEKWADESAVIMYQEFNYHYRNNRRGLNYTESTRRRIKLLDKSAIEEYSEFSFSEKFKVTKGFSRKGGRAFAGIKIIKPDGKEVNINMEDAVEVKNQGEEVLKKIAIPDLQPGDIVDYYYYIFEPFKSQGTHVFDPVVSQLGGEYPVVEQKLIFNTGKGFYINFNSINGAPELQEVPGEEKNEVIYQLKDKHRDKAEGVRWFYPRRAVPSIKFQVTLARKESYKDGLNAFLGDNASVKKNVTESDLLEFYNSLLPLKEDTKYLSKNSIIKSALEKKDIETAVREAYYRIRYVELLSRIEPIQFLQASYIEGLPYYYGNFMEEAGFINTMGSFLADENIDYDIVLALSRHISTAEELLMPDEVTLLIRVNEPTPFFLSHFGIHSNPGDFSQYLEGSKSLVIDLDKRYDLKKVTPFTMPISAAGENKSATTLKVDFTEPTLNELTLDRKVALTGHLKKDAQFELLTFDDILPEEYAYYDIEPYLERADIKKKHKAKIAAKIAVTKKKNLEEQKKLFQKNAEGDMSMEAKTYEDFKILSQGRLNQKEAFAYQDQFTIEGLTKKAGKNFLFEAGKLIGGQVEIAEDEKERTQDIYMPFPRSFTNEIVVTLPEGYTAEGIEKMNMRVENATGGFVSSAKVEGQQLFINTHKYYNNNFEKSADWPLLYTFLEAAYDFTQVKILLKK